MKRRKLRKIWIVILYFAKRLLNKPDGGQKPPAQESVNNPENGTESSDHSEDTELPEIEIPMDSDEEASEGNQGSTVTESSESTESSEQTVTPENNSSDETKEEVSDTSSQESGEEPVSDSDNNDVYVDENGDIMLPEVP